MSFKTYMKDNLQDNLKEAVTTKDTDAIKELFKKSKYDLKSIPAIGTSGVDLVFGTKNLKDAENFNIKDIVKIMKPFGIKLDTSSKDYPGGTFVQADNWKKDGPNDPHEIYISFKN